MKSTLLTTTILWLALLGPGAQAVTITPIALSGQPAPGLSGTQFHTNSPFGNVQLDFATINREGRIAFMALMQDSDGTFQGVFHGTPTNLQLLARIGTPQVFAFRRFSGMDNQGRIAFRAIFTGDNFVNEAIFRSTPVNLQEIVREGGFLFPDKFFGNNGSILREAISDPLLTTSGRIVFVSQFTGTNVTQFNDSALFLATGPPVQSFSMREGDELESAQDGSVIGPDPQGAAGYGFSASPSVVFVSTTIKTTGNVFESAMVGVNAALNPSLINRASFQAPGTGLPYESFGSPAACQAGVFYVARLSGGGQMILFQVLSLGVTQIRRTGDVAPGTSATFVSFPNLAAAGSHVAFKAPLSGGGVTSSNNEAIYVRSLGGLLRLVARKGDPAPDMPDGVRLAFGPDSIAPAINARGQVVFSTLLSGVSTNEFPNAFSAVHAVYVGEPDGRLRLLVRAGQQVQVAPNDARTIRSAGPVFPPAGTFFSGTDSGAPCIFNDLGQLLLKLEFTDGTSGLFLVATDVISEFTFTPGQPARVTIGTIAGATYSLERNSTFNPANWITVASAVGNGLPLTLEDPAPGGGTGFYRVRVEFQR